MSRPRIRTLKPDLWQDERIGSLSRDARLLFIGLITMADDEGRLRALPALILGHVFPYELEPLAELIDWIEEIEGSGLAEGYAVGGVPYMRLVGWEKHQVINRATPSDLPAPGAVTEHSVSPPVALLDASSLARTRAIAEGKGRDRKGEENTSPRQAEDVESSPETLALCDLLASLIVGNDPKAKPASKSKGWRDEARRLLELDGRDYEEAKRVMRWCQADQFWRSNVLSMPTFREKYPKLLLKMGSGVRSAPLEQASKTGRDEWIAWAQKNVPDLPVSQVVGAVSTLSYAGQEVTPERVRARIGASS